MAKISTRTQVSSLTGTEEFPVNQGGVTKKATIAQIITGTKAETDVADAISKKHTQNSDTILDEGGANEVAVAVVKATTDHFDADDSYKLKFAGLQKIEWHNNKTPEWFIGDKYSLADAYQLSALNAIIDIWVEFPNGEPPIWSNASWDLFIGLMRTSPANERLFVYLADQTGTTDEGSFYPWYIDTSAAFIINDVCEITKDITIDSKTARLKAIVDYRRLSVDGSGHAFNLSVALASRIFKVHKKTKSNFLTPNKNTDIISKLTVSTNQLYFNSLPLITADNISDYKILEGTNLASDLTMDWQSGYYFPNGSLSEPHESWWHSLEYIPVYPGTSVTVNTAVNDNAPVILYDRNKRHAGYQGTGTGTTVTASVTFTIPSDVYYIRCSNLTYYLPTFSVIINEEYDKITNNIARLAEDVDKLMEEDPTDYPITLIEPSAIYTVCNDIGGWKEDMRGYSLQLYIDHLVKLSSKTDLYFKENKAIEKTIASRSYYNPDGTTPYYEFNEGEDVLTKEITLTVKGSETEETPITFNHISTLASLTESAFPKILQIGDSVTEGGEAKINGLDAMPWQSWQWVKYFFELDKIESGNGANDHRCLMLGTRQKRDFTVTLGALTNNIRACCEGRSGWTTRDYLYSKTDSSSPVTNPFYDSAKVGTVKFSLAKYLSRYKTLADDGTTRLVAGSTAGTLVSDVNAYDVCTPDIVIIQLGFNDYEPYLLIDIPLMVQAIKDEYPNMIVGISYIDATGTYFPEKYKEWEGNEQDISLIDQLYCKRVHDKMWNSFNTLKALESLEDKIFIIPNGFIQPTAWSTPFKSIPEAAYLSESNSIFKRCQSYATSAVGYHPNNYAQACWGYEVYSWIKYVMSL